MIVQALLVVLGTICSTVCVVTGHPEAAAIMGGSCASLLFVSMI